MHDDAVPMHGIELRKSFENQEIKRALQVILCHVESCTLDSEGKESVVLRTLAVKGSRGACEFRFIGK